MDRAARSRSTLQTRDIVQDEHAMEVIRKPDGKLGIKVLGTTKAVKDECKEQKVGRCSY